MGNGDAAAAQGTGLSEFGSNYRFQGLRSGWHFTTIAASQGKQKYDIHFQFLLFQVVLVVHQLWAT
jgi:hypothetical protein